MHQKSEPVILELKPHLVGMRPIRQHNFVVACLRSQLIRFCGLVVEQVRVSSYDNVLINLPEN